LHGSGVEVVLTGIVDIGLDMGRTGYGTLPQLLGLCHQMISNYTSSTVFRYSEVFTFFTTTIL